MQNCGTFFKGIVHDTVAVEEIKLPIYCDNNCIYFFIFLQYASAHLQPMAALLLSTALERVWVSLNFDPA